MADLVITLKGDAGDFKKQFDQAIASLNKFGNETKASQGYIGSMESQMKLLKTQMKGAAEQDLPALRTQFLNLKNSIREAQFGTETFTSKIGGSFDQALGKASKRLFDLGNVLKASIGFLGVAGIASSFVEATGAAKALDEAIGDLVSGLKQLNKTGVDVQISGTGSTLEQAQKFLDAQIPQNLRLINQIDEQIKTLKATTTTVDPKSVAQAALFQAVTGSPLPLSARQITSDEQEKINKRIALLELYRIELAKIEKQAEKTERANDEILKDVVGVPDLTFVKHESEMLLNQLDMGDAPGSGFGLQDRLRIQNNKKWIEDYFKAQEDAINHQERLQERADQKRLDMIDRAGARVAQTFEDAVSAGLRGGFQEFLQSYLQQTGLRIFSGLIRLAFSSATGGSFGVGNLLGHIFGFAGGGEFYTKGPMPIIVGDNPGGIEKVTVTPISGRGTTGLKNGNIALAGGGSVTSMPMGSNNSPMYITVISQLDGVEVGKRWYSTNGVLDQVNRLRGNPINA